MWDGVDRRRFLRAEYPCLIKLSKKAIPIKAILTHTENISVGGVRVIIGKKVEVMAEVDLEIDLMDTLTNISSIGTINWVKTAPSKRKGGPVRYDTGVQFIALKDEARRRIQKIVKHLLDR